MFPLLASAIAFLMEITGVQEGDTMKKLPIRKGPEIYILSAVILIFLSLFLRMEIIIFSSPGRDLFSSFSLPSAESAISQKTRSAMKPSVTAVSFPSERPAALPSVKSSAARPLESPMTLSADAGSAKPVEPGVQLSVGPASMLPAGPVTASPVISESIQLAGPDISSPVESAPTLTQ